VVFIILVWLNLSDKKSMKRCEKTHSARLCRFGPFFVEIFSSIADDEGLIGKFCPRDNWVHLPHVSHLPAATEQNGRVFLVQRNNESHIRQNGCSQLDLQILRSIRKELNSLRKQGSTRYKSTLTGCTASYLIILENLDILYFYLGRFIKKMKKSWKFCDKEENQPLDCPQL